MSKALMADWLATDPARAEELMESVIASFPRDRLPTATLTEVADHYVRQHFPEATTEQREHLIACIEEANESRQDLYSGRTCAV